MPVLILFPVLAQPQFEVLSRGPGPTGAGASCNPIPGPCIRPGPLVLVSVPLLVSVLGPVLALILVPVRVLFPVLVPFDTSLCERKLASSLE